MEAAPYFEDGKPCWDEMKDVLYQYCAIYGQSMDAHVLPVEIRIPLCVHMWKRTGSFFSAPHKCC